jgi:hypothetical protein
MIGRSYFPEVFLVERCAVFLKAKAAEFSGYARNSAAF